MDLKIGFNTCKSIYNNLGNDNARTTLKIMKGLAKQDVNPLISRLDKDVVELRFYDQFSDVFGSKRLFTYEYNFSNRTVTQQEKWISPFVDKKSNRASSSTVVKFDAIDFKKLCELA